MNERILICTLLCLVFSSSLVMTEVIISKPPTNVTSLIGSNVTLNCDPQSQYSGFFEWRFYSSAIGQQIYSFDPFSLNSALFPPNRFRRVGLYGLNITNIELKDAGVYGCSFLSGDVHALATVVVVDRPLNSASPTEVKVNEFVTLTCHVQFGGPVNSTESYVVGQFPQLDIYFNGQRVDTSLNYSPPSNNRLHTLTRTSVLLPVSATESFQQVDCRVSTQNPPFEVSSNATLLVKQPVSQVIVSPYSSEFAVNDIITCSAHSYPDPDISWVAVSSSRAVTVTKGRSLNISADMLGHNVWNCTAGNELNIHKVTKQISFNVVAERSPQATSSGAMIGIGVGLAIGLSLLLTVIIIVVAFIIKRRQRQANDAKKSKTGGSAEDSQTQPFIYNATGGSNKSNIDNSRLNNVSDRPTAKPRITSTSTLDSSNAASEDGTQPPVRKPRPIYRGSQESLDTTIDKPPIPADRPKPMPRSGSMESLDKVEDKRQPAMRPTAAQRVASNEALNQSVDSDGKPRPAQRPKVKERSSVNTSLDSSGIKVTPMDRSRDSDADQSQDSSSNNKPRPGVAPKPGGKKPKVAGNKAPAADFSTDV